MEPLTPPVDLHSRPEVLRAKRGYGLFYGVMTGLGFAAAVWGMDAYLLSQAHALQPWLKLIVGAVVCALAGGLAGWLAMRLEHSLLAVLVWLGAAAIFAWMTVALPLQIIPRLLSILSPDTSNLLSYVVYDDLGTRFGVAYAWVALFVLIVGVLELPMGEPAIFSISLVGKIIPPAVCIALMFVAGFIVDGLNNEPLRSSVLGMNETIQFAVDHQGETVDKQLARDMHLASLRTVNDLVSQPRELVVGQFDRYLEQIHVLVRFGDTWVDCLTVYNQPVNCDRINP